MKTALFLALILLGGCDKERGSSSDGGSTDAASSTDGAVAPFAGTFSANMLATVSFDSQLTEPYVQSIHITDGVGTLEFQQQTLPAVVYDVIPFAPYLLASIVATTSDGIVVTYAYCKDGVLSSLFYESLTVPDANQHPRPLGTCSIGTTPGTVAAAFLPPAAPLAYGALADVADVDAAGLAVHDGRGTMTLDGVDYDVSVFTTVDCAACGGAGWRELHITLTKDALLAFAILYLQADHPERVAMHYGFRFDVPSLWPVDRSFAGTWTLK